MREIRKRKKKKEVSQTKKEEDQKDTRPEVTVELTVEKIADGYAECNVRLIAAERNEE